MKFPTFQDVPNNQLMLLLFYQRKSYRHPALRESAVASAVHDTSAILDCKDSESFWNEQEIYDIIFEIGSIISEKFSLHDSICMFMHCGLNGVSHRFARGKLMFYPGQTPTLVRVKSGRVLARMFMQFMYVYTLLRWCLSIVRTCFHHTCKQDS